METVKYTKAWEGKKKDDTERVTDRQAQILEKGGVAKIVKEEKAEKVTKENKDSKATK